ncbi:MAG: alpha/beta hydrolase [Chloroflexota bacterium]|nr:alpha/beta hydrolase [Chloroflexota bacterium]
MASYYKGTLDKQIKSRTIKNINGLEVHFLESGEKEFSKGLIVLLHGFPELSYSWRKIIPILSNNGYHVIAPDQRGFGKTLGADLSYTSDLSSYNHRNLSLDIYSLINTLGYEKVKCIIGHDSGSGVAGFSALTRPNLYQSLIMMSAPYSGVPDFSKIDKNTYIPNTDAIDKKLALLSIPRKHYQSYYREKDANRHIMNCKGGLRVFFRAYYHYKSADWKNNLPFQLNGWTAKELAKMPTYYIMNKNETMADTVINNMPSNEEIENCKWLTNDEIDIYANEYSRTTFQGGLNWYRASVDFDNLKELSGFSNDKITIPSLFISGKNDWGIYQKPGSIDQMELSIVDFKGIELINNAGHWVQQEKPIEVANKILSFVSHL